MGKYALSEIWHTLFIREKLFLTAQVVLFHQAHDFGTSTWVSEAGKKITSEGRCLCWCGAPSGFGICWPYPPPLFVVLLTSPFSPHTFVVFIHHHKCGSLFLASCISFHLLLQLLQLVKTSENTHQLSLLPDLLLCSHSGVDMQCSIPFTFQYYCLFPDAWAFCLISSCLNSFSTSAYHCA